MIPTLSQVCTLHAPFEADVADYAAAKCTSVEVWLPKLENYLQRHSLEDVRKLCRQNGVTLPVASYQGGLLTSQAERRREAWDLFRARLELCAELQIRTLIVAADIHEPLNQETLQRALESIGEVAEVASQAGVRIAMEFQARSAFANNLQTAAAIVDEVGHEDLGVCLDLFHFWIGPSKWTDLDLLDGEKLFHVQLSDIADVPRELATDADRILPGEGDIPVDRLVQHLRALNYVGNVSLELMNPQIGTISPLSFAEVGLTALRTRLGLTEP